jgi:type II secretory pathway component PulJ
MSPNRQPCSTRQHKEAAFSLLEVLVALGLSLVVVGAIAAFQNFQLTTLRGQAKQIDLQSAARSVVDLVAREVRRAGKNPKCDSTIGGVETATHQTLRIQTDLDGNGSISGPNENVTYELDSAQKIVTRNDPAGGGLSVLIDGVDLEGSGFRYFDGNGTELAAGTSGLDQAQRGQIRRVRFDLVMAGTSGKAGSTVPRARASTNLDLRNRFFVASNALCVTPVVTATRAGAGTPTAGAATPTAGGTTPTAGAPTATPQTTPQATQTQAPVATPTYCVPKMGDCTASSECCSQNCKNGKCMP